MFSERYCIYSFHVGQNSGLRRSASARSEHDVLATQMNVGCGICSEFPCAHNVISDWLNCRRSCSAVSNVILLAKVRADCACCNWHLCGHHVGALMLLILSCSC